MKDSKTKIRYGWLKVIFVISCLGIVFLPDLYFKHKQEQMFEERGIITAATILFSGGRYVKYSYKVDEKSYIKSEEKPDIYKFETSKKYKLIYDPLDPETAELCMDDNNQYFPMED